VYIYDTLCLFNIMVSSKLTVCYLVFSVLRGLKRDSFSVENIAHDFNHYAQYNVSIFILKTDLNSSLNFLCFNIFIFLIFIFFLLRNLQTKRVKIDNIYNSNLNTLI